MSAQHKIVTAALVIIGDEILSGRTQDKNTSYLATWLNEIGVELSEVRVVPDVEERIVAAVNALRRSFDYVFTTGGIGPTHDDITAESVARAFDVPLLVHRQAYSLLEQHYGAAEFTEARQRMARIPEGGMLIDNPVSIAPGFQMDNVFVMAGVPKIMQGMLEHLRDRIEGGDSVHTKTLTIFAPESRMAGGLADIEKAHEGLSIGSYPFFSASGGGARIVARSRDADVVSAAIEALKDFANDQDWQFEEVE